MTTNSEEYEKGYKQGYIEGYDDGWESLINKYRDPATIKTHCVLPYVKGKNGCGWEEMMISYKSNKESTDGLGFSPFAE